VTDDEVLSMVAFSDSYFRHFSEHPNTYLCRVFGVFELQVREAALVVVC
jgi:hypothetical protein